MDILEVYKWYEEDLEKRDNDDYALIPDQFKKLRDAYLFFSKIASRYNGEVEKLKLVPKEVSSGVTARYDGFYVFGNDMEELGEHIKNMASISIEPLLNGKIEISFTIPNVFRKVL